MLRRSIPEQVRFARNGCDERAADQLLTLQNERDEVQSAIAAMRAAVAEAAQPLEVALAAVLAHRVRRRVRLPAAWELTVEARRRRRRALEVVAAELRVVLADDAGVLHLGRSGTWAFIFHATLRRAQGFGPCLKLDPFMSRSALDRLVMFRFVGQ